VGEELIAQIDALIVRTGLVRPGSMPTLAGFVRWALIEGLRLAHQSLDQYESQQQMEFAARFNPDFAGHPRGGDKRTPAARAALGLPPKVVASRPRAKRATGVSAVKRRKR